jgi:hypothetical protein
MVEESREESRVLVISIPKRGREKFFNAVQAWGTEEGYTVSERVRELIANTLRKEGFDV